MPTLPPFDTSFSVLERLVLDAGGAEGETGASIASLLQNCPALKTLDFEWPSCDYPQCQFHDFNWDTITFPCLTHLALQGRDFAPSALSAFLQRHAGVRVYKEGFMFRAESATAFPHLSALYVEEPAKFFGADSERSARHLALAGDLAEEFEDTIPVLATSPVATAHVKVLELRGDRNGLSRTQLQGRGRGHAENAERASHPVCGIAGAGYESREWVHVLHAAGWSLWNAGTGECAGPSTSIFSIDFWITIC